MLKSLVLFAIFISIASAVFVEFEEAPNSVECNRGTQISMCELGRNCSSMNCRSWCVENEQCVGYLDSISTVTGLTCTYFASWRCANVSVPISQTYHAKLKCEKLCQKCIMFSVTNAFQRKGEVGCDCAGEPCSSTPPPPRRRRDQSLTIVILVVIVISSFLLFGLVVALCCWCCRRRRRQPPPKPPTDPPSQLRTPQAQRHAPLQPGGHPYIQYSSPLPPDSQVLLQPDTGYQLEAVAGDVVQGGTRFTSYSQTAA